jgi:hypothetical protein
MPGATRLQPNYNPSHLKQPGTRPDGASGNPDVR